jgi:hypothetical protein
MVLVQNTEVVSGKFKMIGICEYYAEKQITKLYNYSFICLNNFMYSVKHFMQKRFHKFPEHLVIKL